jgi:hypothetical protein
MAETLCTQTLGRLRRGFMALALGAAVLTAGCHSVDKAAEVKKIATAPTGVPAEVSTIWQSRIQMLQDPSRGGEPGPGLVGRVFLFGSDAKTVACDGSLKIELFDEEYERYPNANGAVKIEEWIFDKVTLKKTIQKDDVGWGYTLFLPTERCTPNVTKVHLMVTFKPEQGYEMYSPSGTMRMVHADPRQRGANVQPVTYRSGQSTVAAPPAANLQAPMQPMTAIAYPGAQAPVGMPGGSPGSAVFVTPAARQAAAAAAAGEQPPARQPMAVLQPMLPERPTPVYQPPQVYPPQQ